ncbi:MAG: hypothetical protein L0Z68_07000 [Gammaproteobacteria bacterium]|nr:hypothetical protein [Gammaproteobacteria bacterium]
MGLFGKSKKEIQRVSEMIRKRIAEIDAILKERDVDGLRTFLKERGVKYQDDDRWINWSYPELPEFMFQFRRREFLVDGKMGYSGFQLLGGSTQRYSVQARDRKSATGPAATRSAKKLKELLSGYAEFYDLDKAREELDKSLKKPKIIKDRNIW